ncbi:MULTISPECIES: class F sortase [Parafrankia]|nr:MULTISPECIES: class F sortase [Parafrankia]
MTFSRLLLVAGAVLIVGSGFRLADVGSDAPSDTERVAESGLGADVGRAGAAGTPGPSGAPGASATPLPTLPPVVVTDPTRVRIPVIGVDAPIIRLGLNGDGSLDVPKKWGEVGWYDKGPAPGAMGPSVLVGHYDSTSGPAVFYRLRALRPGDQIEVSSPAGLKTTFTVDRTEDVTKKTFPTDRAYGPVNRPELRLITCTGAFDEKTKHYLSNLIVYAHANSIPAAPSTAVGPAAPGAAGGTAVAPAAAGSPAPAPAGPAPAGSMAPAPAGSAAPAPAGPAPAVLPGPTVPAGGPAAQSSLPVVPSRPVSAVPGAH